MTTNGERIAGASDILGLMADHRMSDVGGTSGGLGSFLAGLAMTCVGGYLLANQVMVGSSYWNFYGSNTFGITLLPMLIGIGLLFFSGRCLGDGTDDGGWRLHRRLELHVPGAGSYPATCCTTAALDAACAWLR